MRAPQLRADSGSMDGIAGLKLAALGAALNACGGGGGGGSKSSTVQDGGVATFEWDGTTHQVDGEPLAISELAVYRAYAGRFKNDILNSHTVELRLNRISYGLVEAEHFVIQIRDHATLD